MTFLDRSEGAMTALVDQVASDLVEGYAEMTLMQKYNVKDTLLPVLAACIDVLDAQPYQPKRNDEVATWIKAKRDEHGPGWRWGELDNLLDDYRLHADTGTPLTSDVDEMGG